MSTFHDDFKVKNGLVVTTTGTFLSTVTSTSTNTGAVQILGGVGVAKDVYIGGNLNVANTITSFGYVINTSTRIQYQGIPIGNATTFNFGTGTTATVVGNVVNIQESVTISDSPPQNAYTGNLWWDSTYGSLRIFYKDTNGSQWVDVFSSSIGQTAPASPQSNTTTNIAGGTTGSIPIQSNAGLTGFIPIGGFGTVLYSNGTTATWQLISGLSNVNATNVYVQQTNEDRNAGGIFYPTMVSAYDTNSQVDAVSSFTWDDTNNILSSPKISVTATNASVSTITGALTVAGGIGVGKGLYVGGIVTATNMFLNGYQVSTSSALSIQLSGASQGPASTINFSTGTTVSVNAGLATVQSADTLQLVTGRGASSSNAISITSSTAVSNTATGALTVTGGVGVGGGIYVGGTVTATNMILNGYQVSTSSALAIQLSGASQGNAGTINFSTGTTVSVVTGVATVQSADTLQLVTSRGASSSNAISITNATQSTNSSTGALTVSGGVVIGCALNVGGTLQVSAATTFGGPVTFSGSATYVLSTNTFYTDNLIEVHTPPSGVNGQWASDDGKDIGFRFHYYNRTASTDSNAALILADDSQYLEWYNTGAESNTGTFTGANYGTFKTGSIILTNTTASNSTTTGALTVVGGAGIGGNLYVGGNTNLNGSLTFTNASALASPKLQAYQETVTTIGTVVGATNINCALSNIFDITLGAASVTFTFTNPPPSGTAQPITIILRQDATGSRTATFTNAKYTDGSVPVLSTGANQVDVLTFFTVNGGSFWFGTFAMANVS